MAVAYQSTGTADGSAADISVAWGSHQTGDLGVLFVESANEAVTTPSGWTEVTNSPQGVNTAAGTTAVRLSVYYKVAASNNEAAVTVTDTGNHTLGQILVFRGQKQGVSPINITSGSTKGTASTSSSIPGVTTTVDNCILIYAAARADDSATAHYSSPSNASVTNLTERYDAGITSGNGGGLVLYTANIGAAGATGTVTHTLSASAEEAYMCIAIKPEQPTTIALNTTDATDFATDTTPTLEFTGSDADSDDIRYNIQIATDTSFYAGGLTDTYPTSEHNGTENEAISAAGGYFQGIGQSWAQPATATLDKVQWYLSKQGSPTGNAVAKIYAHSGTFGTSSVPTGTALATSGVFDVSTLSGAYAMIDFTFTGIDKISLSGSTNYVLTFEYSGGDALNYVQLGTDATAPTHAGNESYLFSGSWNNASDDAIFAIYVDAIPGSSVLDKVSGTDSGFANTVTGGDTDPFNAGEKVSYTVQGGEALVTGTYYWRARAKAPNADNTYSAWATTRSFTINTSGGGPVNTGRFFPFF